MQCVQTDSEIPLGDMPVDHGDSKLVWRLISSVLPVLFSILDGSVQYFRSLADTSTLDDRLKRDYFHQMAALLRASLCVLKDIFKWFAIFLCYKKSDSLFFTFLRCLR